MLDSLQADCTGKKLTIELDGIVGDTVVLSRFANTSVYNWITDSAFITWQCV